MLDKGLEQYWSCGRKRKYTSATTAQKVIKRMRKNARRGTLHTYKCSYCKGYHVGN